MRKQQLSAEVCLGAFPDDPDFPQLKVASDPDRMLEVFRSHLKPVSGKACQIQRCIPFRFRYRQSTSRCVLQYTLRVLEPGTGRQWDQWVTGLVYAETGEAERLWRELRAEDPRRDIPESWLTFEPVEFIPELRMLVEVFPYDRRLRNLGPVLGGAVRDLEPLLLARLGPGQWRAEERNLSPTRYRTELGAALKYTMQARETLTARSETLRCYLKVYRDQRGEEAFQLLRSLSEKAANGQQHYSVVGPITYLNDLRTLVLEEAPGTSLQQILLQQRDPTAAVRAVARAVAALNQDDLGLARSDSLAGQLEDVAQEASLVEWACPHTREDVQTITAEVMAGLKEVQPAPIHRDLKTDHIFLSDDRVCFIDFDNVAMGDPVRDPAHLCAYMVTRVGLNGISPRQAHAAAAAFAEAYFERVPPAWLERFPVHCAGALIEVAGGMFRRQERHWPERVTAAVREAKNALSGGFLLKTFSCPT